MLIRKILTSQIRVPTFTFAVDTKNISIGVPKEIYQNEKRVAMTPEAIQRMIKKHGLNFNV